MADPNKDIFQDRISRIQTGSSGDVIIKDGLVIKAAGKKKRSFPLKHLITIAVIFMITKSFIFVQMGAEEFESRISEMKSGSTGEVAVAFLFDADPATRYLAGFIEPIFN